MVNKGEVFIFPDQEEAADFIVKKWKDIAWKAVRERGRFLVALSGGKTPVIVYEHLSQLTKDLPWDRTHIFFADERFVPAEDSENNYRLINIHLLSHVPVPKERVHNVVTEGVSLEKAAHMYEVHLRRFFFEQGGIPVFDLIMLGIGQDGHTASLFPGRNDHRGEKHLSVPVIADREPDKRISLTLKVINNAGNIIFFVIGKGKAGIVKKVVEDRNEAFPASLVTPAKGVLRYVLDASAASFLRQY